MRSLNAMDLGNVERATFYVELLIALSQPRGELVFRGCPDKLRVAISVTSRRLYKHLEDLLELQGGTTK